MSWRPAGRDQNQAVLNRLNRDEWKHVALTSRLRSSGGSRLFGQIAEGRLWTLCKNDSVDGVFYISRYGVALPVFEPESLDAKDLEGLKRIIRLRRERLFSIIGTEERVRLLESLLDRHAPDSETYRIFVSGDQEIDRPSPTLHQRIQRADIRHLDDLWPLERSYQIEEVLRSGSRLNERSGRRYLASTLKEQLVFFVDIDGLPVAKAGTNARGYGFDQIGGVFVKPELRKRGLARLVMSRLLQEIFHEGRRACLFVKESNGPALRLYRGMGFKDGGPFRISYWS